MRSGFDCLVAVGALQTLAHIAYRNAHRHDARILKLVSERKVA